MIPKVIITITVMIALHLYISSILRNLYRSLGNLEKVSSVKCPLQEGGTSKCAPERALYETE